MKKEYAVFFLALSMGLLLSACREASGAVAPPDEDIVISTPTTSVASPKPIRTSKPNPTRKPTLTRRPSHTPTTTYTPTITETPTSTPTETFTSTLTSTPTSTPTITRTVTLTTTPFFGPVPTLFPMSIVAMRRGSYPGSDIMLDEQLGAGANYQRYYVYYFSQGLKIYGLLTVPDGAMPEDGWPGIVFNHGYIPPDQYRTTELYVSYMDRLARRGYVVFRIDYRGHGNSEGDPQGAYGDPGYEVDVLNAVASLKRHPQVNPNKIGMWGHSMGGYLALRTMVISHDIKAGVIWAGVVAPYADLLNHWPQGPSIPPANSRKWMDDWPAQFGSPEENPTFWNSISANNYLTDLSGPLQLHYGTSDEEVPPAFSDILANEVRAVGGSVDVYPYPGDNHNISNYFQLAMDRTIEFFDAILKQ